MLSKNYFFIFLLSSLIVVQPVNASYRPARPLEKQQQKKSWFSANNFGLTATIALGAAALIGGWLYKKWHDYKKNNQNEQNNSQNRPHENTKHQPKDKNNKELRKKYYDSYYLYFLKRYSNPQNETANHFEWTAKEKKMAKDENDNLAKGLANTTLEKEQQYVSDNKSLFNTFIKDFYMSIIIQILEKLSHDFKSICTRKNDTNLATMLNDYATKFLEVQHYAYSLNKNNDLVIKHFIENALVYFKPIRTLSQKVMGDLITRENLHALELCPLFSDQETVALRIVSKNNDNNEPEYLIKQGEILEKDRNKASCIYSFDIQNNNPRTIIQLKVKNQTKLSKSSFDTVGDNCPWLSLYNAHCLFECYSKKDKDALKNLNNEESIKTTYNKAKKESQFEGKDMATMSDQQLQNFIKVLKEKNVFDDNFFEKISFINNFLGFNHEEHGLTKQWAQENKDVFHIFLIETTDELNSKDQNYRAHWYVVAVIKKGLNIDYIIMDSAMDAHLTHNITYIDTSTLNPSMHTLHDKSYTLNRIIEFIKLIEGYISEIDLEKLRKESLASN